MKQTVLLFLLIAGPAVASAQYEEFFTVLRGDTVIFCNSNIDANCGARFTASVSTMHDTVVVTERDTATRVATCNCLFDVDVAATGLASGVWQVVWYRNHRTYTNPIRDTFVVVGRAVLIIPPRGTIAASVMSRQGACHDTPIFRGVNDDGAPKQYLLMVNYPNPFNPSTMIRFTLDRPEHVRLEIFDALGRSVAVLVDEFRNSGAYFEPFAAGGHASGFYFCRLTAGTRTLTTKLVLVQ